jgi:hypothetical protein
VARVHLVCVVGSRESALLPHLVSHYRGLGIESWYLIRHAQSEAEAGDREIEDVAAGLGLEFFHTHVGPWSLELQRALVHYAMSENPEDWYVIADIDELIVFDRPLAELVALCERGGWDHVGGCFLDRIAANGDFPDVQATSLWEQYPLACSLSATLIRALPLKVVLARGHVELLTGHHGAPESRELPRELSYAQVHHFKWTGDLVARLHRRLEAYASEINTGVLRETHRFLLYANQNNGRIDVTDPRLRVAEGGSDYQDYPHWTAVMDEAQGWQWTLR